MSNIDLNISPYFDDYDITSDYIRVLFRPGHALQARELTQVQTILQNQISKFGDHIFRDGSQVIDGGINVSRNEPWALLEAGSFSGNISSLVGTELTGASSGVTAKVLSVDETGNYLIINYLSQNGDISTFGVIDQTDSNSVTGENLFLSTDDTQTTIAKLADINSTTTAITGLGTTASVNEGTYYIDGFFTRTTQQTIFVGPSNAITTRIGFTVNTTIIDSATDTTLNDNSRGTSNAGAPGANRLRKTLTLSYREVNSIADQNFVELIRLVNGNVQRNISAESQYNDILKTLARRTHDESGDYALNPFAPNVRDALSSDLTDDTDPSDNFIVSLGKSKAYVTGYEIETFSNTDLTLDRARSEDDTTPNFSTFQETQNYGRFFDLRAAGTTATSGNPEDVLEFDGDTLLELFSEHWQGTTTTSELTGFTNNSLTVTEINNLNTNNSLIGVARAQAYNNDTIKSMYVYDIKMLTELTYPGAAVAGFKAGRYVSTDSTFESGTNGYIYNVDNNTLKIIEANGTFSTGSLLNIIESNTATTAGNELTTASTLYTIPQVRAIRLTTSTGDIFIANLTTVGGLAHTDVSSIPTGIQGTLVPALAENETTVSTLEDATGINRFDAIFLGDDRLESATAATNPEVPTFEVGNYVTREFDNTEIKSLAKSSKFDIYNVSYQRDRASNRVINGAGVATAQVETFAIRLDSTTTPITGSSVEWSIGDGNNITVNYGFSADPSTSLDEFVNGMVGAFAADVRFDATSEVTSGTGAARLITITITRVIPGSVISNITRVTSDIAGINNFQSSGLTTVAGADDEISSGTEAVGFGWATGDKQISLQFPDVHAIHAIYESTDINTDATADTLNLSDEGSTADALTADDIGSILIGETSGTIARVIKFNNDTGDSRLRTGDINILEVQVISGSFSTGEVINSEAVDNTGAPLFTRTLTAANFYVPTTSTNIIRNFIFDDGQRDNFYDVARIIRKANAPVPTGQLLILYSRFDSTRTTDQPISSVDSYTDNLDIDVRYSGTTIDLGETLSAGYKPTGINLRNVIDYRKSFIGIVENTAIDSNIGNTANRGTSPFFTGQTDDTVGTGFHVAKNLEAQPTLLFNTDLTYNYKFYLPRTDIISLDSSGNFITTKGVPSLRTQRPSTPENSMLLNIVNIPPFTRYIEDVAIEVVDNRRYTMRDIANIDKRLANVEEATVLSLLESKAQQTDIRDASNISKFKTGFITDDFATLSRTEEQNKDTTNAADADHEEFSASFDPENGILRPEVTLTTVSLEETSSSSEPTELQDTAPAGYTVRTVTEANGTGNGTVLNKFAMLNYTTAEYIKQPLASGDIRINPFGHWKYIGILSVNPPMDRWKDIDRERYDDLFFLSGQDGSISEATRDAFIRGSDLADVSFIGGRYIQNAQRWNEWETRWSGSRVQTVSTGGNSFATRRITTTNQVNIQRTVGTEVATKREVKDKLVDSVIQDWIRPSLITVSAINMKPNAPVAATFDNVDISSDCIQFTDAVSQANLKNASGGLTTDITGAISFQYIIPANTFRVGTRKVELRNVANDTQSSGTYTATGITEFRRNETTLTRSFVPVNDSEVIGSRTNTNTQTIRTWTVQPRNDNDDRGGRSRDPLAQAFEISDQNDTFITGMDFYMHTLDGVARQKTAVEREHIITSDSNLPLALTTVNDNSFLNTTAGQITTINGSDNLATVTEKLNAAGIEQPLIDEIRIKWDFPTTGGDTYVEFEIRNMVNGFPGPVTIKESYVRLTLPTDGSTSGNDNTLYASDDASIPVKVRFEAPILLDKGELYCFVLLSPNNTHSVWTATLGEADIASGNTINKAPYIQTFFKSENAVTWVPDPTTDMKFTIYRAVFNTDQATLQVANIPSSGATKFRTPGRELEGVAVETTLGSPVVKVTTKEPHGMFGTFTGTDRIRVKLDGVRGNNQTGTHLGGLPIASINTPLASTGNVEGTDFHFVDNATLYTFEINLGTGFSATETTAGGGRLTILTADIQYDLARPNIDALITHEGLTDVRQSITTKYGLTSGVTNPTEVELQRGQTAPTLVTDFNENIVFDRPRLLTNDISDNSTSLDIGYRLSSTNDSLSPVLDVTSADVILVSNLIADEANNSYFNYVTKEIGLQMASSSINIIIDTNLRPEHNVEFYVKTLEDGSGETFDSQPWVQVGSAITGNTTTDTFVERSVELTGITPFSTLAVKIESKSSNSSTPPLFKDLRIIATA